MTSQSSVPLRLKELVDYGVARFRDQAFDAVAALWRKRRSEGWSQKRIADNIGRDPAWVSRNLRAPGNWTLRIVGELIQALDGEAEIIVSPLEQTLEERPNRCAPINYVPAPAVGGSYMAKIGMTNPWIAEMDCPPLQFGAGYLRAPVKQSVTIGLK